MGIKIVHTGDWHIGTFNGPENNGINARYLDICKCLNKFVEDMKAEKPDIILIAGDIFHSERVWASRGLSEVDTAVKILRELREICPVVVMRGTPNHDGFAQFETLKTSFSGDENIHIITEPSLCICKTHLGTSVQVACVPGFDRGFYRAKTPGLSKEEENEVFTKAVEDLIIGLKAQCDNSMPTVLVSHFTIQGANMESGQTAFFSKFEPIVYPSTLLEADYDLVCFGHIHRPQQLDGCKNTYYCGAISQLNFNDENQSRGYYIHNIERTGEVNSEFRQLPTREHITIWLNDDDIRELNEMGPERLTRRTALSNPQVINDRIIRVLYDCTDTHNKAFNHALLEKWLYDVGQAFFVQEITPQKISITVDKRSLEAEGSPEDNLGAYLTEKDIAPERIGEIVELARPIIAEATEKATKDRNTGLFVPVEIEVKNYRNYRYEKFSFEDIHFCTINGSNGVGKSSLFMDAMCDALFEETRERELTGWICNDPSAKSGSIKFTFKLGEKLYRVTRTRQKSGKATLNIAEYVDEEWVDRSKERFKDTQAEIINIIGMDSLTLKACALIMQDQYGLFLQADKEARMNILGSILGLSVYGDMEELAAEKATATNRTIRTLQERAENILAGLPNREELVAMITAEEENRKLYEAQAAEKTAAVDKLKVKLNTQLEAASRAMKLNSKISSLTATRASKEATKTTQAGIVSAADVILSKEAEIAAGVAKLHEMLEKEKELIKGKATYDSLAERKEQLVKAVTLAESSAKEMRHKKAAIVLMKIGPLKQALTKAEELTAMHKEYEEKRGRMAELSALEPEWKKAVEELEAAQRHLADIEADGKRIAESHALRIKILKDKVELLADSGCPDVEKASCKFLADALKAKTELPEAEKEAAQAAEEYEDMRREATATLVALQKAVDDSLYHPEEMEALRGDLRLLEAAEKEYAGLEGLRKELAIINERAEDLAKVAADAEKTVEKGRKDISDLEAQLNAVAQASAAYDSLQTEIALARQWEEKEKQLPVAREKKEAAAQRVLELDTEIKGIDAEITDAKAELAEEQSKTIGREHLEAQVRAAEREIAEMQQKAKIAVMAIGGLNRQFEQLNESVKQADELQAQVNGLVATAAGYEELKKAFSQDGIPHNIIRSIIPIFEATATNILGQMSGGKMSVEFVTEKVLKSNNKKEVTTLDIIINDSDTGRLPYMSRSGGERVKAALSVILALSEIKQSKIGVKFGFLWIDEPPYLDQDGIQAYCTALVTIQERYPNTKVMAISHDETFKARFPQSVTVYKDETGSHVMND